MYLGDGSHHNPRVRQGVLSGLVDHHLVLRRVQLREPGDEDVKVSTVEAGTVEPVVPDQADLPEDEGYVDVDGHRAGDEKGCLGSAGRVRPGRPPGPR